MGYGTPQVSHIGMACIKYAKNKTILLHGQSKAKNTYLHKYKHMYIYPLAFKFAQSSLFTSGFPSNHKF